MRNIPNATIETFAIHEQEKMNVMKFLSLTLSLSLVRSFGSFVEVIKFKVVAGFVQKERHFVVKSSPNANIILLQCQRAGRGGAQHKRKSFTFISAKTKVEKYHCTFQWVRYVGKGAEGGL